MLILSHVIAFAPFPALSTKKPAARVADCPRPSAFSTVCLSASETAETPDAIGGVPAAGSVALNVIVTGALYQPAPFDARFPFGARSAAQVATGATVSSLNGTGCPRLSMRRGTTPVVSPVPSFDSTVGM